MKYVNNLDDFYIHTKNHIRNVNVLAKELLLKIENNNDLKEYYRIPDGYDFNKIKKIVMGAILLHDKAKITIDRSFLEDNQLERLIYEDLYKRYGKGFAKEEWVITKPIVDKLNAIDDKIINNYCDKYEPWIQKLIKDVEFISDRTERGSNLITPEEMGQKPMLASEYLDGKTSEHKMSLILFLEKRYHDFCTSELNRNILSLKKYSNFIDKYELSDTIEIDDLSFSLKDSLLNEVKGFSVSRLTENIKSYSDQFSKEILKKIDNDTCVVSICPFTDHLFYSMLFEKNGKEYSYVNKTSKLDFFNDNKYAWFCKKESPLYDSEISIALLEKVMTEFMNEEDVYISEMISYYNSI